MQIAGILNGENINYDHHFAALVKGITNAGIVEGFSVVNDKLTAGICTVDCLRTNGQQLRIVFESDEEIDLSTLANGTKIFVEVDQSKIDDGSQNEENGSGIAEIKFDTAYPTKNFLALAEIVNNIPLQVGKMVEIKDSALENSPIIKDIETQVREVENIINIFETDGLPTSHLSEKHIVGEKIVPGVNVGFLQHIADNEDNLLEPVNISDVAANTKQEGFLFAEIPENRDGTFSGSLPLDMVGASTQNLVVEIHKVNNDPSTGEPVVIDEIVGSTTIAYSAISSTKARVPFTVTGMSTTALKTGDHIGIRAYMPIVDSSNYYRWYADATQYSSGLGSSSYSGSAWTNKTSMLGVKSDYLAQSILCRASTEKEPYEMTIINTTSTQSTIQIPNKGAGVYKIVNFVASFNPDSGDYNENAGIRINGISVTDVSRRQNSGSIGFQNGYIQVNEGDVLEAYSSGYMLNTLSIEITFSKNKRKINNKVYRPLDTYEIGTVQSFLSEGKIDAIFSGEFGLIGESVEERDFNICIGNNNLFSPNHDIMSILSDNAEYSTLPYLTKNINIQGPINNPNKFYAKFLISELTGEFKISVVGKTSYTNGNVPIYFLVNGNQVATTNILGNTINEFSFGNVRIKRGDIISIAIGNDGQVNNSTNIDSIKFYNCLLSSKSVMQII